MELTRREALRKSAGVAAVVALPAVPEPATAAASMVQSAPHAPWRLCVPMAYGYPSPWTVVEDGKPRRPTDDEVRAHVQEAIGALEDLHPDDIRRIFADTDGELFAAYAEYDQAKHRRNNDGAAEALNKFATTPARTNAGAALQLRFVHDSLNGFGEATSWQLLNLVMSAQSWLHGGANHGDEWITLEPHPSLADAMAERREPVRSE